MVRRWLARCSQYLHCQMLGLVVVPEDLVLLVVGSVVLCTLVLCWVGSSCRHGLHHATSGGRGRNMVGCAGSRPRQTWGLGQVVSVLQVV